MPCLPPSFRVKMEMKDPLCSAIPRMGQPSGADTICTSLIPAAPIPPPTPDSPIPTPTRMAKGRQHSPGARSSRCQRWKFLVSRNSTIKQSNEPNTHPQKNKARARSLTKQQGQNISKQKIKRKKLFFASLLPSSSLLPPSLSTTHTHHSNMSPILQTM